MLASKPVERAVLKSARPKIRERADRSRGGMAVPPRCLIVSEREGIKVSKRRNRRDGTSQKTSRMAVIPISSMRRGGCDRTRVDQVM